MKRDILHEKLSTELPQLCSQQMIFVMRYDHRVVRSSARDNAQKQLVRGDTASAL